MVDGRWSMVGRLKIKSQADGNPVPGNVLSNHRGVVNLDIRLVTIFELLVCPAQVNLEDSLEQKPDASREELL